VRIAWVHPTWRDLVIEHLGGDPVLRRHFLAHSGIHGVVLAVSVAGGAGGERRMPLLASDADWDTLGDRLYDLVRELEPGELTMLLETLAASIDAADTVRSAGEIGALARMVLERVARRWDAAHAAIPLPTLDAWLRLSRRVEPRADPPSLALTWAELLPAEAPAPDDLPEVQRFTDWLILCRILSAQSLAALGWGPGQLTVIAEFVDRVEADPSRSATDAVIQALEAAARVHPELGGRARRVSAILLEPDARPAWRPRPPGPDEPGVAEGFDVARVLADL
jgi:hypothetical protein